MTTSSELNENVKLWVTALRSGEYDQAKGSLRNSRGYCCLGVACDIYMKTIGKGEWSNEHFIVDGHMSATGLPQPVFDWLKMYSPSGRFSSNPRQSLIQLNDDEGFDFNSIADAIENISNGIIINE